VVLDYSQELLLEKIMPCSDRRKDFFNFPDSPMFRKRTSWKKLTGLNVVNPTAILYAGAGMLSTMGYPRFSKLIETAVTNVYLEGKVLTQDVGGKASTDQFTDRVIQEIALLNHNSVKF